MNKEQQELLDEAYQSYLKNWKPQPIIETQSYLIEQEYVNDRPLPKDMFIHCIKTDLEFSKKWGLKIEERELSLEERMDLINKMHLRSYSGWQNWGVEEMEDRMNNDWDIPTRLITIEYKDKKIESYG